MNDQLAEVFCLIQLLFSMTGICWLLVGSRKPVRTKEAFYTKITHVHLPSSAFIYASLVLGVLRKRYQQNSDQFFVLLLCLETLMIFDMISRALRIKRELHKGSQRSETPGEKE